MGHTVRRSTPLRTKKAPPHVPYHPDGELFNYIYHGIPGTSMPSFSGIFTQEEVRHILNHINRLVNEAECYAATEWGRRCPTLAPVAYAAGPTRPREDVCA